MELGDSNHLLGAMREGTVIGGDYRVFMGIRGTKRRRDLRTRDLRVTSLKVAMGARLGAKSAWRPYAHTKKACICRPFTNSGGRI